MYGETSLTVRNIQLVHFIGILKSCMSNSGDLLIIGTNGDSNSKKVGTRFNINVCDKFKQYSNDNNLYVDGSIVIDVNNIELKDLICALESYLDDGIYSSMHRDVYIYWPLYDLKSSEFEILIRDDEAIYFDTIEYMDTGDKDSEE